MVIGRRFGIGNDIFEIVGVAADGFTGTEPGMVADIFAPTMMSVVMPRPEASWLKTFVHLQPGVAPGPVRDHLRAAFRASNDDGAKGSQVLLMDPPPWASPPSRFFKGKPIAAVIPAFASSQLHLPTSIGVSRGGASEK